MVSNQQQTRTDFGFEQVAVGDKAGRVRAVFDQVAENYDLMNDCMSLGLHRLWKQTAVRMAAVRQGDCVLDVAAGTGDLTQLWAEQVGQTGVVVMTDINAAMLSVGEDRLLDAGLWSKVHCIQSDAEALPFASQYFDCVSIGFGLRNMTHHDRVLAQAYRVLKPGGRLVVLEFSHPDATWVKKLYDAYSFSVLPKLGAMLADDEASYRYLVESIRRHPDHEVLRKRILQAGFDTVRVMRLSMGVVAIHCGVKY